MISNHHQKLNTNQILKLINISFHPQANIFEASEAAKILSSLISLKEKNFKAPTMLFISYRKPELIEIKTLLNKIRDFQLASPVDINIILQKVRQISEAHEQDFNDL